MAGNEFQTMDRPEFKVETADDLRELITQAELIVANLRGAGPRAQTLLYLLDAIESFFELLEQRGIDLRAEASRVEDVERLLQAKDSLLVREMSAVGGLAAARKGLKLSPEQWWWYLDERVAQRQKQQVRRWLTIGGVLAAGVLVLSLLYTYVFPPDPRRTAVAELTGKAESALMEGDGAMALAFYRQAAEVIPEDAELHAWVGVLAEAQGDEALAGEAYAAAEALAGDRGAFLRLRGMAHLRLDNLDRAEADATEALAIEPDSVESWFILASVYEGQGNVSKAVDAFEKTADLASEAGNSAMVVMAKTRLGMLLQAAPMMQPPENTPTPASAS